MVMENQMAQVTKIAPGQEKKPLSLLNDLNAEEASYSSIYCGLKRDLTLKMSYQDIARYDRR
jgi:hypothetical protein